MRTESTHLQPRRPQHIRLLPGRHHNSPPLPTCMLQHKDEDAEMP
jgi:hypothetical protein